MLNDEQKRQLGAPLSSSNVKSRQQAGRKLSYIEGWHVIAEANRIFGFDGWASETVDLRCVSERERKIGQSNPRDGWGVSYVAKVRVTVTASDDLVIREGIGAGHGIDVDFGLAHESAVKEAETDARKRALMTFGNPFGLALYDKEQTNVSGSAVPDDDAREQFMTKGNFLAEARMHIQNETDAKALKEWWQSEAQNKARREACLTNTDVEPLKQAVLDRIKALTPRAA